MTEQEFRELTAYQPPTPANQNPPVSSIAAAVTTAGNKGSNGSDPPVPKMPGVGVPTPPQAKQAAQADIPSPAPIPQIPVASVEQSSQDHFISQIHQQPPTAPMNEAPPDLPEPEPTYVPAPVPESNKMAPLEKHHELMEQFARLSERHKRMLAERDTLAKQVAELKRVLVETKEARTTGRDYKEEIRLLGKLIDNEQSLRKAVLESGAYTPGETPYARHDRLVEVFLNIVGHTE